MKKLNLTGTIKSSLLFAFVAAALSVNAQQVPLFSNYLNNDYVLNPAIAGTKEYTPITLSSRLQWLDMKNAPKTQIASVHGSFNKSAGLGLMFLNHSAGATNLFSLQMAYAYRIKLNEKIKLSFGLAPMIIQHSISKEKLTLDDANDNTFNRLNGKSMVADANAGVYLYSDKYFVSFSVPQVLGNKIRVGDELFKETLRRHYLLSAGYDFNVKEKYKLTPSFLVKTVEGGGPFQFDLNVKGTYNELVWAGLSYRSSTSIYFNESAVIFFGVSKANFAFGYSFDYSFASIRSYNSGSHEIFLTYRFLPKKPVVATEGLH